MAKKFLLISLCLSVFSCCGNFRIAVGQQIDNHAAPTTRFDPVALEISGGYSYPSKWNASAVVMILERNVRLGAYILGPYDNYTSTSENPKPNITTWGLSLGGGIKNWHSPWKGTSLEGILGSANRDRGEGNVLWNYGFQTNIAHSIYTDRKGSYAFGLVFQVRRVYIVTNEDQHGVAYDSSQKGTWVYSLKAKLDL
ncbi:MAG: hypothetical protein KA028_01730 [Candidatus Pacebacteria bacterium]|jgi:hypothetical protein|nr:hypothetical protein [Candidatus Paceibacterota bacterium]